MAEWNYNLPWYHGSPHELEALRAGSSISQNKDIARVFSHRPALVSMSDDGVIKHTGALPGYLYIVTEEVKPEDIYPHPHPLNASRWEWITRRELRVKMIERTEVKAEEQLSDDEIAEMRRKQSSANEQTFAE